MKRETQKERVLNAFKLAPDHQLSVRYIKRVMGITEANARVSNLRKDGHDIVKVDTDEFGFAVLELRNIPKRRVVSYEEVYEDGRVVRMREVIKFV